MKKITVLAKESELNKVQNFIHQALKDIEFSQNQLLHLDLLVEEIFVNIALYAYEGQEGNATIVCDVENDPKTIVIKFIDSGVKYNPLEREDPNISTDAKDRAIGGLGIFITKKLVDSLEYYYKDKKNCLILRRKI